MGRGRGARRIAVFAFASSSFVGAVALAVGVLGGTGAAGAQPATALPLHPVAGSFRPDATTLSGCSDTACFQQAFGNVAYREGPQAALALVERAFGDGTLPACHQVVHAIGSAALARNRNDVGVTFAQGSATCGSGYYHGVLERALVGAQRFDPAALAARARTLCADPRVRALPLTAYQCLHGLGHGLMISTGLDLPLALRVCNRLATGWDQESCKGGVFMENMSSSYGVRSRWLRDDDLVYPCNRVAVDDKLTCYQLATSRMLQVLGTDWETVAETCAAVERGWVSACFQSMGRDVSGESHRDSQRIAETCAVAATYGGELDCVAFAAMDMTNNFTDGTQAAELCALSRTAAIRGACFHAIGSILGRLRATSRERAADCRALSRARPDVAGCVAGAREGVPRRP